MGIATESMTTIDQKKMMLRLRVDKVYSSEGGPSRGAGVTGGTGEDEPVSPLMFVVDDMSSDLRTELGADESTEAIDESTAETRRS